MRKSFDARLKNVWVNLGWYPGDPFKVISVTVGETSEAYPSRKVDHVTFLNIQFLYFVFAFGWSAN